MNHKLNVKLRRISGYITKWLVAGPLLVVGLSLNSANGQSIVTDTIPTSKMWAPTMFRFGYDLLGPLYNVVSRSRGGWEVTGEIDLYKFFLIAEYGNEHFDYGDSLYHYRSNGNYLRLGFDINTMSRDKFGSELFFGFRYVKGSFTESLSGSTSVYQWGFAYFNDENPDLESSWIEFTAGMKAKVWKKLYMGYTLRLKLSPKITGEQNIEPYRIPGYGLASETNFWGINYYIAWRFDFRQKYMTPARVHE